MATSKGPEPKASAGFVRLIGAFEVVGGTVLWYVGAGWYLDGILPVRWAAIFLIGFGAMMLIAPGGFRRRASRFHDIAERIDEKKR
jgi:hypothetical protein